MNELVVMEPEFVEMPVGVEQYNKDRLIIRRVSMYPYSDLRWKAVVEKFHIRLPKKLVMLCDGTTTCKDCGAVYSGRQMLCTREIGWFEYKSTYHTYSARGDLQVDSVYNDKYSSFHKVTRSFRAPCHSTSMEWTEYESFSLQEGLFGLLSSLEYMEPKSNSPLEIYRQFFSPDTFEIVEKNFVISRLNDIEFRQENIVSAIKQICEKMNAAGNSLMFGSL
jgi:hypothetical protein